MAKWFYYNESGEKIEVTGGQLKGLAKAGMITPDTIVETEDGKSSPARRVKGLTFPGMAQREPVQTTQASSVTENSVTVDEQMAIDEFCPKHGTDVSKVDEKNGLSLLHEAVMRGTHAVVRYLISQGADVKAKVIKYLSGISVAPPVVAKLLTENPFELHEAVKKNDIVRVAMLTTGGANVNVKDSEGGTPLHYTFWNVPIAKADSRLQTAFLLINAGADVNTKDKNDDTILQSAIANGRVAIVRALVNAGARVNADDVRLAAQVESITKISGLVAALNTTLPGTHNVGATQRLLQAGVQQSNNRQLPIHQYKNCFYLTVIPIIPVSIGFLIAVGAFSEAYFDGASMSAMFAILVGVFILIAGIVGAFMSFGHWHRCPSCGQHWAVALMELQTLHSLRAKNIMQNVNDPTVSKTVLLFYKCKHCGYEWIYLWD